MPWDAGASMERLQRTLQSLRELKQRKRESNRAMFSDLLGKGADIWGTIYNANQAKQLELARQGGVENLEYIRQGGDVTSDARKLAQLEKEYKLRGGELGEEYKLRAGEEGATLEALYPVWDRIWPGETRASQFSKYSYLKGMTRPEAAGKDTQAESQWTSAADVAAKGAIEKRFANPEKWPNPSDFWNVVATDPTLGSQVRMLYQSEVDKYLTDYIKDSATRTMAVDTLMQAFEVYIQTAKSEDQGDGDEQPAQIVPSPIASPAELGGALYGKLGERVGEAVQGGVARNMSSLRSIFDAINSALGIKSGQERTIDESTGKISHPNVNVDETKDYNDLLRLTQKFQQIGDTGNLTKAKAYIQDMEVNASTSWLMKDIRQMLDKYRDLLNENAATRLNPPPADTGLR